MIVTETGQFIVVPKAAEEVQRIVSSLAGTRGLGIEPRGPSDAGPVRMRYSGDPTDYVDCGRVVSSVKTEQGERRYDFPASAPFMQYQIMNKGRLFQVERRMTLEAVVTLKLKTISPGRTRVEARADYNLTRQQTATAAGYAKPLALSDSVHFRSGESAMFPNAATRCEPTGRLESSILAGLR